MIIQHPLKVQLSDATHAQRIGNTSCMLLHTLPNTLLMNNAWWAVDGCGYDSQLKYTICEACRTCHSILSMLRPVFRQLRHLLYF